MAWAKCPVRGVHACTSRANNMAAFKKLSVKTYPRLSTRETSDNKFWKKYNVSAYTLRYKLQFSKAKTGIFLIHACIN